MILCNHSGEFLKYIPDSPAGSGIDSMYAFSRGIIVAGAGGCIWAFEGTTNEEAPYKLQQPMICSENRDKSVCDNID